MDNANMPPGSDNSNDSDDLIAELARLMAAEAKGDPEPDQLPSDEPSVEAQQAPASQAASPIPRLDGEPEVPAQPQSEPLRPVPAFMRESATNDPAPQPDQNAGRDPEPQMFEPPAPDTGPEPTSLPGFDMPEPAAVVRDEPPAAQPAADGRFAADPLPPSQRAKQQSQPAPEPKPTPRVQTHVPNVDPDDPIGALISAQLGSTGPEEFDTAPMADHSTGAPNNQVEDKFGVAPVFGVGGPAAQRPSDPAKRDPLNDIESLISTAIKKDKMAEPPAPAEPQIAAPQPTHQAPDNELSGAANAAEAAILAATNSMRPGDAGVEASAATPTVDPVAPPPPPPQQQPSPAAAPFAAAEEAEPRRKSGMRWQSIAGPLVAAALLVAVGLGLYWVFGTGSEDAEAPVLAADTTPTKQPPAEQPSAPTDTAGSVVLSDSNTQEPESIERLISREDNIEVANNDVSRVITPTDSDQPGLVNRKVRTVTVRPDGTIVSGDDAVAGGQQLPVDRPDVPTLSAADTPPAVAANQNIAVASAPTTQVSQTPALQVANPAPPGVVAPVPAPRIANRTSTPTAAISAPVRTSTPTTNTNTTAVNLITNSASATQPAPVRQPAATPVSTGSSAPAYVQLSSQRSQDAASRSLSSVRSQFSAQLNGGNLEIQEVNLGERGTFYRVRLPAQSIEAANNVCANIKSAGGDCFVRTD